MIQRPPISILTDTLFPYTTLVVNGNAPTPLQRLRDRFPRRALHLVGGQCRRPVFAVDRGVDRRDHFGAGLHPVVAQRSEERRVGKECVSTCRSRWSPYH